MRWVSARTRTGATTITGVRTGTGADSSTCPSARTETGTSAGSKRNTGGNTYELGYTARDDN